MRELKRSKNENNAVDSNLVSKTKKLINNSSADIYELSNNIWVIESDRYGLTLVLFDEDKNTVSVKNIGKVGSLRVGKDGAELCSTFGEVDWALNL